MTDDKNLKWMPGCQACNDGIVTEIKRLKGAGMGEREACRRMVLQQEAKYGAIIYDEEAIRSRYRFMTGKMRKRSKIDKPKPTTWQALARHFDDDVRLYEVWNEYNIGIGMPEPYRKGGSADDYFQMLKHTYPRLKKLAPGCTVIAGACTSGGVRDGWLEGIVQLGALDYCDILSIHTYNYGRPGLERTPEAHFLPFGHLNDRVPLLREIRVCLAHDVDRRIDEARHRQVL